MLQPSIYFRAEYIYIFIYFNWLFYFTTPQMPSYRDHKSGNFDTQTQYREDIVEA